MGWGGASLVLPLGCANEYPRDGVICPTPFQPKKDRASVPEYGLRHLEPKF